MFLQPSCICELNYRFGWPETSGSEILRVHCRAEVFARLLRQRGLAVHPQAVAVGAAASPQLHCEIRIWDGLPKEDHIMLYIVLLTYWELAQMVDVSLFSASFSAWGALPKVCQGMAPNSLMARTNDAKPALPGVTACIAWSHCLHSRSTSCPFCTPLSATASQVNVNRRVGWTWRHPFVSTRLPQFHTQPRDATRSFFQAAQGQELPRAGTLQQQPSWSANELPFCGGTYVLLPPVKLTPFLQ